jgi:putative ABC transport system permease protein
MTEMIPQAIPTTLFAAADAGELLTQLSPWQVGCAAALIVVCGLISIVLRLGMGRSLFFAAVRTVVQLLLIGFVLRWVFSVDRWYFVLAVMTLMTIIAGIAAVRRTSRRYPGMWTDSLVTIWASSWLITAFAIFVVVQPPGAWYQPQYAIPLLGMLLGNALTATSLGLGRLTDELLTRRAEVETLLALGATRWEAARDTVRTAIRTGMVPIVNAMMVVGLVSLPGMMTGQILSGVDPMEAVKYQIIIMFLIAAATSLGVVGAVLLGYRRLFTACHQFRYDRIRSVAA